MSTSSLLLLLATITSPLRVAPIADAVADGPHFRVTVHFDDQRIAKSALETAEAVWPIATALFGAPAIDPAKPLEVHIYRTADDYEKADVQFGRGNFKTNMAFTSAETTACYIAMQPDVSDAVLARIGLPSMMRELVAHEAMHAICDRAWPNAPTLPMWLAEGSATWVCQETLVKNNWVASAPDDPMLAHADVLVKQIEAEKKLPGFAPIFDDMLGDQPFYQRYAVWNVAFRFLHEGKHAAALTKILAAAKSAGGGAKHGAEIAAAARLELGGDAGLAALDKEFSAYVRALSPHWDEVYRSLSTAGDTWTQAAFKDANAIAWRTGDVGADKYEVSGELEIFDGDAQQMNLLLGRTPNGLVQISFVAGQRIVVFEYDNRRMNGTDWKRLGSVDQALVKTNHSTPFRVKVAKSKLTLEIDGKAVGSFDVGDHPMKGACGLGALEGSAGAWRKFTVKKG
jgi:hypothetical protein